jgi:hypothetical protein
LRAIGDKSAPVSDADAECVRVAFAQFDFITGGFCGTLVDHVRVDDRPADVQFPDDSTAGRDRRDVNI